jgi:uncharacterized protein (DUF2141 family)
MTYRKLFAGLLLGAAAAAGAASADHLNITTEGARVDGGMVVFPAVKIDMDGYVVVHAVEGGSPVLPGSIGHTAVPAGISSDVAVAVEDLAPGDYVAMIHYETNGNGTYDFGEGMADVDTPGMRPDDTPFAVPFTLGAS